MRFTSSLVALAVSLCLTAPVTLLHAQDSAVAVGEQEALLPASDLAIDPEWVIGQLPNGMRYMIRQNATPPGTALVRMEVEAGRFDERDNERGLAHFVEHMAFNGSTNIPEGEMVKLLEREGLAFGADTNAETNFAYTQYKLNLPNNDAELLDTALMLMRETASELTFDPEAVERERGILLAERRDRTNFARRNLDDQIAFFLPGSRLSERFPMLEREDVATADAGTLKGYWARNYVPSKTTLIVAGDFDSALVERSIRAKFADWQPAPSVPAQPDAGPIDLTDSGRTNIYTDPALPERLVVTRYGPYKDEPDTSETRRDAVLRSIAFSIVNRRLQRLTRREDPPFRGASFGLEDVFETASGTNLSISTVDGAWQRGLEAAVAEYSRAMAYGFTDAEVAEQVANIRASLENRVANAGTRNHAAYIGEALGLIRNDRIPTTPDSALARFTAMEPDINPETVRAAMLARVVPLDDPLIRYSGKAAPEGGEAMLRTAWETALAEETQPPEDVAAATFAYTDFGAPGEVVMDETIPELGIRTVRFANGVMLNLKRTDLQQDRIAIQLNLDGGDMLATQGDPLAVTLAGQFPGGGLGEHSRDELQTILAGRAVGMGLGTTADTFRSAATVPPRDLELQLQLMTAFLTDPGYREEAVVAYRNGIDNFFARLDATPAAALGANRGRILSGGDPRFSLQDKERYAALSFEDLQEVIGNRLVAGAIELAMVGDLDEDIAIAAAAKTLGALPPREGEFQPYLDRRQRSFTQDRSTRILTHAGSADQALAYRAWPTNDDDDLRETLTLSLLARVAQLDITEALREELGASYSPGVGSFQSSRYPGYGTFTVTATVEPGAVETTQAMIDIVIGKLRAGAIDEDTLQRARQPLIEEYDNYLDTNAGWMALAARAQSRSERLGRYAAAKEMLPQITTAELQAAAMRYLAQDASLAINVLPQDDIAP